MTFCVSKLLFWRQKWVASARHGNSLVVRRRVSAGRIMVVLFWTKYAVPHQLKPGILKLTTSRGQSNLRTVFIFVNCEEKGCYRIVLSGHLSFDCHSYCELSRRMQGPNVETASSEPHKLLHFFMISVILWEMGKHAWFSSQPLSNGSWMTGFYSCHKTDKKNKSLYGFGGRCFNIIQILNHGFEPCFKVYNLVSVHPKITKLGQMFIDLNGLSIS